MELLSRDVLVVGGGVAGLRAAIAVAETGPRLRVAVIFKVYPMRSHTVSAEGGAAAVIKPGDSPDAHAYDTIPGGDWLCGRAEGRFLPALLRAPGEPLRAEPLSPTGYPGGSSKPSMPLEVGQRLACFEVLSSLGAGGIGEVSRSTGKASARPGRCARPDDRRPSWHGPDDSSHLSI